VLVPVGTPRELAALLPALNLRAADPAESATGLLVNCPGSRLLSGPVETEWEYRFELGAGRDVSAERSGAVEFAGPVGTFAVWALHWTGYEHAVRHTVRFRYEGGSGAGVRTVRVKAVEMKDGLTHIVGVDLDKDAFRRYRADRVTGDVELLD
jgi:hypothetical protein